MSGAQFATLRFKAKRLLRGLGRTSIPHLGMLDKAQVRHKVSHMHVLYKPLIMRSAGQRRCSQDEQGIGVRVILTFDDVTHNTLMLNNML